VLAGGLNRIVATVPIGSRETEQNRGG